MRWRRLLDAPLGSYVATALTPALALSGALRTLHPTPGVGLLFGTGIVIGANTMVTVRFVDDVATVLSILPAVSLTVLPLLAYFPYLLFATTQPVSRTEPINVRQAACREPKPSDASRSISP